MSKGGEKRSSLFPPKFKLRKLKSIVRKLIIYEILRRKCKELNYKPSLYWYQAKVEALLWVLGIDFTKIHFCEWEEPELLEAIKNIDIESNEKVE